MSLLACKQNNITERKTSKEMINQTNSIIEKFSARPYYQVNVKTSGVSFDIRINDFPVFTFFGKSGGTNMESPINNAILKSGTQTISVKVMPLKGRETIIKENFFSLKVNMKKDAYVFDNQREEILVFPEMVVPENGIPYWEFKATFEADVPYNLNGWMNSKNLIDQKNLENKVHSKYIELQKLINNKDNFGFSKAVKEKLNEEAISLYEKLEENPEGFQVAPEKALSISNCIMKFYGNGKLVTLENEYGESCLKTEVVEEGKTIVYTYDIFLHIPQGSDELEVIR